MCFCAHMTGFIRKRYAWRLGAPRSGVRAVKRFHIRTQERAETSTHAKERQEKLGKGNKEMNIRIPSAMPRQAAA